MPPPAPAPAAAAGGTGTYTPVDPNATTDDPTALSISPTEMTSLPAAQVPPNEPAFMGPVRGAEFWTQAPIVAGAATAGAVGGTAIGGPPGGLAGGVAAAGAANAFVQAGFDYLNAKLTGKSVDVLRPGEILPWMDYKGGKMVEDATFGAMGELVISKGLPFAIGIWNAAKQAVDAGTAAEKAAVEKLGPLAVVRKVYSMLKTTPEDVAAQRAVPVGDVEVSPSVAAQDAYFGGRGEVYRQQISDKYDAVLDPHRTKVIQTAQQGIKDSGFGSQINDALEDLQNTGRGSQISPKAQKVFDDAIYYGGGKSGDGIPSLAKTSTPNKLVYDDAPRSSASVDELLNTKSRLVGILMGSGSNTEKSIARTGIDAIDQQLENSGALPPDARAQLVKLGKTTRDFYDVFQNTAASAVAKAATTPEIGEQIFAKDERQAMSIINNGTPEQIDQLRRVFADTIADQGNPDQTFQFLARNPNVLKALYPGFGEIGNMMNVMGYGNRAEELIKANPKLMEEATTLFRDTVNNNPELHQELNNIQEAAKLGKIQDLSNPAKFIATRLGYGAMVAGPLAAITHSLFYYSRLAVMGAAGVPLLVNWGLRALLRNEGWAQTFMNAYVNNPKNSLQGARMLMELGASYLGQLSTQGVQGASRAQAEQNAKDAAFYSQFPPVQIPGQ
jgi:hypothetical protein